MDPRSPRRILVVDDDTETRSKLRDVLETDGYQVDEAGSIAEALGRPALQDYLAILIDRRLPDGSGEQVLRRIAEEAPGVARIILTEPSDIQDPISVFRKEAVDYLVKPIDARELRAELRQIAEQRRVEDALRESRDRLRLISECGLVSIATFTPDGLVIDANESFLHMAGFTHEELAAGQVRWTKMTSTEWWSSEAHAESLSAGRVRPHLMSLSHSDGHQLWWLLGGARLPNHREWVAFAFDVTKIRAAEERALQVQRLAAVGEAMTGLIHEGRNALQRGHACLEMLAQHVKDQPEALRLLTRAQEAQDDLHRLYEEVRNYAAPLHLARQGCDLGEVWRGAWAELAPIRKGRRATVQEETGGLNLHVVADPSRLAQVFRNLLENALAAAPDPVEVVVRAEQCEHAGRPALTILVHDKGPGLKAEQARRAFEPFYTTKTKGIGLGLAISRRIVEAHGGELNLGETSGPGAEFRLILPVNGP